MKITKENSGITIVSLAITIIVLLIVIMVVIIEIDRGIFEHAGRYIIEIEKSNNEAQNLRNKLIEEHKDYL